MRNEREFVKKNADHNPSDKISDIRLADFEYLIQGPVTATEDVEQMKSGLWIPISKDMKMVNVAKVLMRGRACTMAKVGEYVVFSSITGENFNHLKPQPICRHYFDNDGLFTLSEQNVRAVICEKEQEVQNHGSDDGGKERKSD